MTSHTNRSETRTNYSNGSKYSNNGGRRDRDRDRDRDRYGNGNRTQSRHGQPRLNPGQSTSTSVPRFENPLCAHVPDTDADTDSYPLLVVDSKYMNVCRGKEESENKPAVNVYDPTHWRGSVWVGPMFIRLNAATQTQNPEPTRIRSASNFQGCNKDNKYAFSRDGVKWVDTYEATFSKLERTSIDAQKCLEEEERFADHVFGMYNRDAAASWRSYAETGGEDGFAWAERQAAEYDAYIEKMEADEEEQRCVDMEESYDSCGGSDDGDWTN